MNSRETRNFLALQQTILSEFREHLDIPRIPSSKTQIIMALSAPPTLDEVDPIKREQNPENIARVNYAVDLGLFVLLLKKMKPIAELLSEDLDSMPFLAMNGDEHQIGPMTEIALRRLSLHGFNDLPDNFIVQIDAGPRTSSEGKKAANTQTQFEEINTHQRLQGLTNLVIVTSFYHAPRVDRTADKNLEPSFTFETIAVPIDQFSESPELITREMANIWKHANAGFISETKQRIGTK